MPDAQRHSSQTTDNRNKVLFPPMDPEFQRALTIVLIVGGIIGAIGYGVLFLIFRAFGKQGAGGSSHVGLIAGLIAFVFVVCLALFALSYSGR